MAGALRKTMVYLGLAEEDQRYGDDSYDDDTSPQPRPHHPDDEAEHRRAGVTPIKRERQMARVVTEQVAVDVSRISTVHPRTYNDAKTIGESFREGIPVIMNLTDMPDADAKRLVDFSAGLVFGLRGSIERVTSKVFLLSPAHVEVTEQQPAVGGATAVPPGFFNQS